MSLGFRELFSTNLAHTPDHSEFRGYVFALLFYKRINDVYLENVAALEKELGDPELARDHRMHDFVVQAECLWEKVARKTERELGSSCTCLKKPPRYILLPPNSYAPAHMKYATGLSSMSGVLSAIDLPLLQWLNSDISELNT